MPVSKYGIDLQLLAELPGSDGGDHAGEFDGLWAGDNCDGEQYRRTGTRELSIQSNDADQGDLSRLSIPNHYSIGVV